MGIKEEFGVELRHSLLCLRSDYREHKIIRLFKRLQRGPLDVIAGLHCLSNNTGFVQFNRADLVATCRVLTYPILRYLNLPLHSFPRKSYIVYEWLSARSEASAIPRLRRKTILLKYWNVMNGVGRVM
jgi:hypothetical protein